VPDGLQIDVTPLVYMQATSRNKHRIMTENETLESQELLLTAGVEKKWEGWEGVKKELAQNRLAQSGE